MEDTIHISQEELKEYKKLIRKVEASNIDVNRFLSELREKYDAPSGTIINQLTGEFIFGGKING